MNPMRRIICLIVSLLFVLLPAMALGQEEEQTTWTYESEDLTIRIYRHQEQYSTKGILTYFVADIRVSDPSQLFSAFANDEYTRNSTEDTESIAQRNGALLAINGDYYNHDNSLGIILRNGELYRDKEAKRDMLVIDKAGDFDVFLRVDRQASDGRLITGEQLASQETWQTFEFGPALIDNGEALELPKKYFIYTTENIREPRTAIGQVGPLHYVVLVADGRRDGWSTDGMKFKEMQDVLLKYGCEVAYNLDGGGSTTLYFNGEILNKPSGGKQRSVSDIIGFREP